MQLGHSKPIYDGVVLRLQLALLLGAVYTSRFVDLWVLFVHMRQLASCPFRRILQRTADSALQVVLAPSCRREGGARGLCHWPQKDPT